MGQITVIFKDLDEMKKFARELLGVDDKECKSSDTAVSTKTRCEGQEHQPIMPTVPVQAAPQIVPTAPVASGPQTNPGITPPTTPQMVATAQTTYTLDDLARAGMTLMDSGRQGELQQLLTKFGVEALPALPKGQYGAFATALREMGAQI